MNIVLRLSSLFQGIRNLSFHGAENDGSISDVMNKIAYDVRYNSDPNAQIYSNVSTIVSIFE